MSEDQILGIISAIAVYGIIVIVVYKQTYHDIPEE
jgi:hypothetical protein